MLSPPPSPEERHKISDARRSHADRSVIANYRDPSKPIYTIEDLKYRLGWTDEAMIESYRDAQLGRCPDQCGRYMIDLPPREISIDIIDPDLPPVWGVNTQWMCVPDNRRKSNKSREQRISERIAALAAAEDRIPSPIPYEADSLFGSWLMENQPDT